MISHPATERRLKLTDPVVVGKDILELLSSAMYVNPLSIFREYVQNSADSLDEASELGLYRNGVQPAIFITVDPITRSATIRDTGAGVPRGSFIRTLTGIGGSRKRGTTARGFRGVGRLAGLGYCQTIIMRSKGPNDTQVSCMHWDCRRLKELLRDPADLTLDQMLHEIIETESLPADGFPKHFFEIEMCNMLRYKNDLLLNEAALGNYLSQVGPVPFCPSFTFASEIEECLAKYNAAKSYTLTLNGKPVFRPYRNTYEVRPKVYGIFTKLEFFEIPGLASGLDAVGWILHGEYLGAIPDRHGVKGLRLRVGNIQIGNERLLDMAFPEPRFNSWTVGECHVMSPMLVPNARRDDFEQNNHYANLFGHLLPKAKEIAKACRVSSAARARQYLQAAAAKNINGQSLDWTSTKTFLLKNSAKPLTRAHTSRLQNLLRNESPTYAELMRLLVGTLEPTEGKL